MSRVQDESSETGQLLSSPNTRAINQPPKQSRKEKFKAFLGVALMLFFEVVLPLILFYTLKDHIGDIKALIISGVPPLVAVIFGFIRNRRIDMLGVIILISFIVGAGIAILKDNPRLYLLRESAMTGSIGLAFLITLIPIKIGSFKLRPMVFYFGRDMATGGTFSSKRTDGESASDIVERYERYWNNYAVFRNGFYVLTILWGVGLIVEVPIRTIIVFKAPTIDDAVLWSNIVSYSWLTLLTIANAIYSRIFKKKCLREIPVDGEPLAHSNKPN